ncbi:MAG: HEAT repeat domain-containing protein [Planctomycetota bacterium]
MSRRAAALLGLVALAAAEEKQVDWAADWESAFRTARETNQPVMVCINSKDGEVANERAATETYRDPEFVALSREFVMIVVGARTHEEEGACPRFGGVTCAQHLDCYKELRNRHGDQFFLPGTSGEMISPQHAWFKPDGTLLRRKEYELAKAELLDRMRKVLEECRGAAGGAPGAAEGAAAPLSERDLAELRRAQEGDTESRRAALGNVLATGKTAAVQAVVELLHKGPERVKCDALRALGRARSLAARPAVEQSLKDRSAEVRSFAAVALEDMGQKESVEPLLKRAKTEGDTTARKNVYRALGACGGGAADKEAAKALLKGLSDKQLAAAKHAALAMRAYEGPASALVVKPLEQAAAREKSPELRAALVYTLAHIGSEETTLPVFEKLLQDGVDEMRRAFLRTAISVLKGDGGDFGPASRWLYAEDRDDPARKD